MNPDWWRKFWSLQIIHSIQIDIRHVGELLAWYICTMSGKATDLFQENMLIQRGSCLNAILNVMTWTCSEAVVECFTCWKFVKSGNRHEHWTEIMIVQLKYFEVISLNSKVLRFTWDKSFLAKSTFARLGCFVHSGFHCELYEVRDKNSELCQRWKF